MTKVNNKEQSDLLFQSKFILAAKSSRKRFKRQKDPEQVSKPIRIEVRDYPNIQTCWYSKDLLEDYHPKTTFKIFLL